MKEILIRLEDELYEQCKNTKLTEENEGFDFHIIKSVANGTPLEDELKKIKAEIENMWIKSSKDLRTGEVIYENLCEHSEVLDILNKHISKLKGE